VKPTGKELATRPAAGSSTVIDTKIPYIGQIDYSNPFEVATWGAVAASAVFAPGWWKLALPVGILAVRYQLKQCKFF
jgi:hypothetical protein